MLVLYVVRGTKDLHFSVFHLQQHSLFHYYISAGNENEKRSKTKANQPESKENQTPPPKLSPVLAKYKQYLQSYYNARALAPADKYLPTLKVPYINLAIVGREYCSPAERDEFTKQTLHGGVDELLQRRHLSKLKTC